MSKPKVTLATSASFPNLDADEAGLPDALAERGIDVSVKVWNDPDVDWDEAGIVVLRSVRDYAKYLDQFKAWTKSIRRILNPASVNVLV